jgi:hypothetical protein
VVTRGREFPNSKRAGRNASEPTRSLVNELEEPTLWSDGEGRWTQAAGSVLTFQHIPLTRPLRDYLRKNEVSQFKLQMLECEN